MKTGKNTEPMFSAIAPRYDLFNHIASLGLDFYWRRKAAQIACDQRPGRVLDICCGSGDLAFAIAQTGGAGHITGLDISEPMLAIAREKQKAKNYPVGFEWVCAEAENTGLETETFDVITCAFGMRNIVDKQSAMKEAYRLLRDGGKICILEFALPKKFPLRQICLVYLRFALSTVGFLLLGKAAPTRYLYGSILDWDKNAGAEKLLEDGGFEDIKKISLVAGAVCLHTARKLKNKNVDGAPPSVIGRGYRRPGR